MIINYWAVLVSALVAMAVGFVWYGPLFGKLWMRVAGLSAMSEEAKKKMMSDSMKLYVVQFLLSLFQVWVLAYYIAGWQAASGLQNALWIWAAFVIPAIAGSVMWAAGSAKEKWAKFFVQGGAQLVSFVLFGLILGMWR